ncbi:MAG: aminopeptidase [Candidatus Thermoplasmatota archaeon]|nr:aminopeptidase [Candidatus Thermoplasmatota archaeon]
MDERIRKHAQILVEWSTEIEEGDNVIISANPEAQELITALYEEIGKKGGKPVTLYRSNEASAAYLKNHEGELQTPEHKLSLFKEADAVISVRGDPNQKAMNNVPGEKVSSMSRANKPINDLLSEKRTSLTVFPTNSQAQLAGMSLEEYRDFVWNATLRDWEEVEEKQEILKKKMDEASEVFIKGKDTEIEMNIAGNVGVNSSGKHNLPSGEVYIAPIPDSVEGEILFDLPIMHRGKEINGVKLRFEDGEVVEYSAEKNEEILENMLYTDEGARRLGELGIGTNRGIDRFTRNILFDEKMGDTIHLALGRAIPRSVGEDGEGNDSAVHVDMIKDMSEGTVEMDGETILKDGKFVWEL